MTRRGFGRIRPRDSGRWTAAYVNGGLLYRAAGSFPSKGTAEGWLAQERRLIDLGVWTPPAQRAVKAAAAQLTLAEYETRWLEQRAIAPRTRESYSYLLTLHVLPVLGDLVLTEIDAADIRQWFHGLGTDRPTMAARAYGVLTAIFNSALDDELLDRSPARIRGAGQVRHAKRSVVLLEPTEVAALADAMPAELRMTILLAAWLGLRRGETFALRRSDIAPDASTVKIERAVVVVVERRTIVSPPKTRESRRTVTVPTHLRPLLLAHLAEHVDVAPDALLFCDPVTGSHYAEGRYRGPFDKARASIGKPDLHFHDLRHFGGVMAALAGGTTKEVMDRLGHTTTATSMRYQHTARGRADVLASRLSTLAEPPGK
jgi:integrase